MVKLRRGRSLPDINRSLENLSEQDISQLILVPNFLTALTLKIQSCSQQIPSSRSHRFQTYILVVLWVNGKQMIGAKRSLSWQACMDTKIRRNGMTRLEGLRHWT